MAETRIDLILEKLGSPDSGEAWSSFLQEYGEIIFQVIRHFESDSDDAADCFQFVCERFCEARFRRLRRFQASGPAKFTTWLRAVVRNLCLDWQRKRFGRPRMFRSVARLSDSDQQVFRLVHERGLTEQEALLHLAPKFPELTPQLLSQAIERINGALTSNQNWLLTTRTRFDRRPSVDKPDNDQIRQVTSAEHDPEMLAITAERRAVLARALRTLPANERLLVRLRFEEEMTLDQIAKLLQMGNAQRVDRQIKQILVRLRLELEPGTFEESGKTVPSSVKAG
jgi:RNA polymerase sigma factor (sigma-70 family)